MIILLFFLLLLWSYAEVVQGFLFYDGVCLHLAVTLDWLDSAAGEALSDSWRNKDFRAEFLFLEQYNSWKRHVNFSAKLFVDVQEVGFDLVWNVCFKVATYRTDQAVTSSFSSSISAYCIGSVETLVRRNTILISDVRAVDAPALPDWWCQQTLLRAGPERNIKERTRAWYSDNVSQGPAPCWTPALSILSSDSCLQPSEGRSRFLPELTNTRR